jgi:hypothetical protein
MYHQKFSARAQYRQQEGQRVKESAPLSDTFRKLKSLKLKLAYYDPDGSTPTKQITYEVNLNGAKSVFRFNCPNDECVRGDFDLSDELATAVAAHRTILSGKKVCQGWRSKTVIDSVHCHNVLCYTLTLAY